MANFMMFERDQPDPDLGRFVAVNIDHVRNVCFHANRLRLLYHDGSVQYAKKTAGSRLHELVDLLNNRPDLDEPRDPAEGEVRP